MRSDLFSYASRLAWIRLKKMENVLLCDVLLADVTLFVLFTCLVTPELCSADVRNFLQMNKIQNFSDASEDEDDKVSDLSLYNVYIYILYFCFPADSTSVFVMVQLCQVIWLCIPRCSLYLVTTNRIYLDSKWIQIVNTFPLYVVIVGQIKISS